MSATVKLARGVRLVCAVCGHTVASAGRRVERDNRLSAHLAARHATPGTTTACAGSLERPRVSEAVTLPAVVVRSAPPSAREAEKQVVRWNRDCPTGTR